MLHPKIGRPLTTALLGAALLVADASATQAQNAIVPSPGPRGGGGPGRGPGGGHDYPPIDDLTDGYEKVVSTADGQQSLYTVWVRRRDGQMLAELPRDFGHHRYFIALTVASGENYAGLQAGDMYVYWKQFDNRLALIEPNVEIRSNGDQESKSSVQRLFTDRVVLDVPILTIPPQRGPVIDLDELLLGHAQKFFGYHVQGINSRLATIKTAKAFPHNIEIGIEVPIGDGRLKTLHYSVSLIPDNTGYKPRPADERVGYFITAYSDLGKYKEKESRVRFINRWHLEKADGSLEMSPPKNPIVFYIEHTTPIRYRRWVREGILSWNKAFEKVGLSNAIEVYYQDAASAAHMEKDPEDVRYNFIRWLNNNVGTAIGPSRVHPLTGEILDADIILTDGWIRHFWKQYREVLPEVATEGFSPETLAWLDTHPKWDPRVRLAPAAERERILFERARRGTQPYGGHPLAQTDPKLMGGHEFDGLTGRVSQANGLCLASQGKAMDVGLMRMILDMIDDDAQKPGEGKKEGDGPKVDKPKEKEKLVDDMPETFIGPLLAELVAHEVGHTLGLRHNFKSSSAYTMAEINSKAFKGTKVTAGSVMDYLPININVESGEIQGDYCMTGIGPYDYWAIEYGYTLKDDLKPILERVAEPGLAYATDEDTIGPDPLARRYDFSKNPLDYAKNQLRLAKYHRQRIVEKFVKDGESWSKARGGYEMTLNLQTQCLSMMARWVGGAFVNRDRKGDKNGRPPIEVVPSATQRDALKWLIENTFLDEAYGLNPDLLSRMTIDQWLDGEGGHYSLSHEATWPVHDRIMGIQASTLTMLMNPSTLRRVYDNEFRVPADQDALTLPELLQTVNDAIWKRLDQAAPEKPFTARKPMISSLRRNLQREHLERLTDLVLPGNEFSAAQKPITTLAVAELKKIQAKLTQAIDKLGPKADPYTLAHLTEARDEIKKALDAQMIYNAREIGRGGGGMPIVIFGEENKPKD